MTRSDHRASSGISSHASNYRTPSRASGSIRCTFGALLLLLGLLLLGRCLLLGRRLLLRLCLLLSRCLLLGRRLLLRLCLLLGRLRRWCLR
jgi:hypothetical protein